jgi:hypothetical protein
MIKRVLGNQTPKTRFCFVADCRKPIAKSPKIIHLKG